MPVSITISLPDQHASALKVMAQRLGVAEDQLLRAGVIEWLDGLKSDFNTAADYVLEKNSELYKRLA